MSDFNPYAAPLAEDLSPGSYAGELWREGDLLVMTRRARLPNRCYRCNAPSSKRLRRMLMWLPWYWLLLFFIPALLIIPLVLIIWTKAEIDLPICDKHRRWRRKMWCAKWALVLAGVASPFFASMRNDGFDAGMTVAISAGFLAIFAGGAVGIVGSQTVTVKKMDERLIWLDNFNPAFLRELPSRTS